jgi:hypothetical protein
VARISRELDGRRPERDIEAAWRGLVAAAWASQRRATVDPLAPKRPGEVAERILGYDVDRMRLRITARRAGSPGGGSERQELRRARLLGPDPRGVTG